jgi:hypothetical protein
MGSGAGKPGKVRDWRILRDRPSESELTRRTAARSRLARRVRPLAIIPRGASAPLFLRAVVFYLFTPVVGVVAGV